MESRTFNGVTRDQKGLHVMMDAFTSPKLPSSPVVQRSVMRVNVWGPLVARVPGLRHIVSGLALATVIFPVAILFGYAALAPDGNADSATTFLSTTAPGVFLGFAAVWAGLLIPVVFASRLAPGGFAALVGWKFAWRDLLYAAGFVAVAEALNIASSFVLPLFGVNMSEHLGNTGLFTNLSGPAWMTVAVVFGVAVGAPVVEEIFYRGLALSVMREKLPTWAAALTTSILFGLMHVQSSTAASIYMIVSTTLIGLGLSYLRIRTGRLGTTISAHVLFNSINIALALLAT
jgi:membrane protease YdiL (CAAX protease family)